MKIKDIKNDLNVLSYVIDYLGEHKDNENMILGKDIVAGAGMGQTTIEKSLKFLVSGKYLEAFLCENGVISDFLKMSEGPISPVLYGQDSSPGDHCYRLTSKGKLAGNISQLFC